MGMRNGIPRMVLPMLLLYAAGCVTTVRQSPVPDLPLLPENSVVATGAKVPGPEAIAAPEPIGRRNISSWFEDRVHPQRFAYAGLLAKPVAVAPTLRPRFRQVGIASWYGIEDHGTPTADGGRFNRHAITAAHKSLPFNTRVLVRNLENGRSVIVRITDRGPYKPGRIIDLSEAAARQIGLGIQGLVRVEIETLD